MSQGAGRGRRAPAGRDSERTLWGTRRSSQLVPGGVGLAGDLARATQASYAARLALSDSVAHCVDVSAKCCNEGFGALEMVGCRPGNLSDSASGIRSSTNFAVADSHGAGSVQRICDGCAASVEAFENLLGRDRVALIMVTHPGFDESAAAFSTGMAGWGDLVCHSGQAGSNLFQ